MTGGSASFLRIPGHDFHRPELLKQALTHSSSVRGQTVSNQRMEFLGDRVLGLVVARMLYERFGGEEEGEMSRRHAALVRRDALARVAADIGLAPHIDMSPAEEQAGGRSNPGIIADACEAVIAALYLDGGIKAAEDFIIRCWTPLIDEDASPPKDAKTELQEWAQAHGLGLPSYRQVDRQGKDHAPVFFVEVTVEGFEAAAGSASNKRAAEQEAAGAMLSRINKT
ncbi:MAG: ribonuclease III [Rhodospirillales bacterium RIFCSPLOWO2_12_FULL_58_28]|nr:MAG: ribonuclease III [Rhodospirillales bacterium RIFCSPLOWO2_02_FULL_58_16]OHC79001.1 MAG: ribonuclease III [Rhodospirillales bacterium RIFCSPLOWO2_12_FULL_58_28]